MFKILHMVTWVLLIVGGLNWLAFGAFGWDIGQLFGGMSSMLARAIYILVGLSAVYEIVMHYKTCRVCSKDTPATAATM